MPPPSLAMLYLISYDLLQLAHGPKLEAVTRAIRELGGRQCLSNVWIVKSELPASQIGNRLITAAFIPEERLLIVELGKDYQSHNLIGLSSEELSTLMQ